MGIIERQITLQDNLLVLPILNIKTRVLFFSDFFLNKQNNIAGKLGKLPAAPPAVRWVELNMEFPTFWRHTQLADVKSNWRRAKENRRAVSHLQFLPARQLQSKLIHHLARDFLFFWNVQQVKILRSVNLIISGHSIATPKCAPLEGTSKTGSHCELVNNAAQKKNRSVLSDLNNIFSNKRGGEKTRVYS